MLHFPINAGDEVLKHHCRTAGQDVLYTSKETNKEMLASCGDIMRRKKIKTIYEAGFFSVVANKATDSANDGQLSISIQHLENGAPNERFIGFHMCHKVVSGKPLQKQFLTSSLNDSYIHNCYMVKDLLAIYTHCAAHRLNLCVVKCCSLREVNSMMQTADSVALF